MNRYRIDYSKTDEARYSSVLDLQKIWERAFRRVDLPISYSQGFHPQPRLHMAAPLPLGFSGLHELLDIWTECGVDPSKIIRNLTVNLPNGIRINSMDPIALNDSILQFQVISACYKIVPLVSLGVNRIESSIKELLSHSSIQRTRRGKHMI